jgi:hypothetical protein
VAGPGERIIYENTLGIQTINFPNNQPISDDISTTVPDGCNLTRYRFKVLGRVLTTCNGGANHGNPCTSSAECPGGTCPIGGAYTVTYALYTTCPFSLGSTEALRDLVKIPGSGGVIEFPDEGPRTIEHLVDPLTPVALPTNVYLGIKFNRSNCGTVVGAPAMVGFSGDQFDVPVIPCNGYLGGFPNLPHASFWLEMWGSTNCAPAFAGYKCQKPSGGQSLPGANVQAVDDIRLIVNDCNMVGYEVAVRGTGFYTFDLRGDCESQIIAGTERTFQIGASTTPKLQIARFTFDPPIRLTTGALYFGFKCSSNSAGTIIAGIQPIIGESTPDYFIIENATEGCKPVVQQAVYGAVNLAITCAGAPPVGTCCDMALLECQGGQDAGKRCLNNADCVGGTCEAVCREVRQVNCPWPPKTDPPLGPAWVEGGTCELPPFAHACGQSACCKPDDTCENLTKNECNAVPPLDGARLWQGGDFCGEGDQACPFSACVARQGVCSLVHEGVGCSDPICCTDICTLDPWCCHVEWDRLCVDYASELCSTPGSTPAINDFCYPIQPGYVGAIELTQNAPHHASNLRATESEEQGFCCNGNDPGSLGWGTVWFKFVATEESAQIDTCASDPEGDTLVNVYAVGDPTNGYTSCQSLSLIGCADDGGCPNSDKHSRFCVDGLTPGVTYYIMLASKTLEAKSTYQIELTLPCQYLTPFPSGDCNQNESLDGCDLADNTSADCNLNGVLDECEITAGTSSDCDANGFLDECTGVVETLRPPSPGVNGGFGHSLDMQGEWMVIGTSGFYVTPTGGGSLYIYRRAGGGWAKEAVFFLLDAPAYVDLDGDWIVTGSDHDSVAYLFHFDATQWLPAGSLQGPDVLSCPRYGFPVAVHGDVIALGKGFCQNESALPEAVYIFRFDGVLWIEEARIEAPGTSTPGGFGASVSFDDDRLLIGAPYRGAAYIFRRVSEVWEHEATLAPPYGQAGGFFGRSSVLKDDLAFVGATLAEESHGVESGAVYLFRRSGSSWTQDAKLTASDAFDGQRFGWSVRVAENTLAVGATSVTGDGGGLPGSVYVFSRRGLQWIETAKLVPPGDFVEDSFGHGVATDGSLVAVGAPATQWQSLASTGTAYVYQPAQDCNQNDVPDLCDVRDGGETDCNHDDVPDECNIDEGSLSDCNLNQLPDECEPRTFGDFNFDARINLGDFSALQRCFAGGGGGLAACCGVFDAEPRDGDADLVDFAAFSSAMTGP